MAAPTPFVFATLGPEGSNHEINVRRYLAFRGLSHARVDCLPDFDLAFEHLLDGRADFVVQACLHPQVGACIGRHHPRCRLVDCFLGPTAPMGVLTHAQQEAPRTLGLMPSTRVYFDASRWPTQVELSSGPEVARLLLAGDIDSGFTDLSLADRHPGLFRIELDVGAVDMAWLVYGREGVCEGRLVASAETPLAQRCFR